MTNYNNKIQWQRQLALRNKTISVSSVRLFNISSMLCNITYFQINVISLETYILIVTDFTSILYGNINP